MRGTYPPNVSKEDIDDAITAFERSADPETEFGFGPSTDYDLLLADGRRLPPKAIAGIATQRVLGRPMKPSEFSAGEGHACFRVLRKHGFQVERKHGQRKGRDQGEGWSDDELRIALAAYLEMLAREQAGVLYNKAEHNRRLREDILKGRTRPAVEYRMANISTALAEVGLPWIKGYVPLSHVGDGVKQRILGLLAQLPAGFALVSQPAVEEREVQRRANVLLRAKRLEKPQGIEKPVPVDRATKQYARSPEVVAFVRQEANGLCELCAEAAPFTNEDGVPFLEVHHVVPLAEGGPDTVENAVAICPNCHRRLHYSGDRQQHQAQLYKRVDRLRVPPPATPQEP